MPALFAYTCLRKPLVPGVIQARISHPEVIAGPQIAADQIFQVCCSRVILVPLWHPGMVLFEFSILLVAPPAFILVHHVLTVHRERPTSSFKVGIISMILLTCTNPLYLKAIALSERSSLSQPCGPEARSRHL
ncbi:hypothetical protein BOTBODRAFT_32545 [Botryobasidium botryosum FD-172 SS1]|uniref:Uncharacterized protein n=1 Tax=Botryobasidium botryosum (strain FD-172 SS1) TaxID=930990 RepID=A0A067MSG4_BOTB1|nr:hypothetical protein BOTBODRAFT_32545 [Botryobasidium botryosum FD-172 SS1]